MSNELNNRISEAISETINLRNRELAHEPELRYQDKISFYNRHINFLINMLEMYK